MVGIDFVLIIVWEFVGEGVVQVIQLGLEYDFVLFVDVGLLEKVFDNIV